MVLKILAAITLVSALVASAAAGILVRTTPYGSFSAWFFPLLVLSAGILTFAVLERRSPVFGKIFWKGEPGRNRVAITFDDGPNEPFTSRILDILKEKGVRATFFMLGQNCERYPGAVRRIAAEGHELGNHTWTHRVLPLKSPAAIAGEIARTSDLIERLTGRRPTLFRAPHGWRNPWVDREARRAGCIPVAWTLGVWDTDRPGVEVIVRRTLRGIRDGCILLVHDGRGVEDGADSSQLVRALPTIIDEIKRRGFHLVTVSEMMEAARR